MINYKAKFESLVSSIQDDLRSSYKVSKGEELKSSDEFDIYVIVGPSLKSSTSSSKSTSNE